MTSKLRAIVLLGCCLFFSINMSGQIDSSELRAQVDSLFKMELLPENFPFAQRLKKKLEANNDLRQQGRILVWIGRYYRIQEDYSSALEAFFQQNRIANLTEDSTLLCKSKADVAVVYRAMNKPEKALSYLDEALQLANRLHLEKEKAQIYNEYGILHIKAGRFEKALQYLQKAKALIANSKVLQNVFAVEANLGIAYVYTNQPEKGLKTFFEFYERKREVRDSLAFSPNLGNIAFAYEKMGKKKLALMYYDSSIYYANKFHQNREASVTYLDLSNFYTEMNNPKKAFDAYKKYHQFEKAAISEATQKRISKLEVAFETEKKERELKLAQSKIKELDYLSKIRFQRILLVLGGLIALLILIIVFYFRQKEKLKRIETEEKLVIAELESAQLKAKSLRQKLENKKADLTTISLSIDKENQFYTTLISQLEALKAKLPPSLRKECENTIHFCNANFGVNEKLLSRQENIDKINRAFFQKLEKKHGKLSSNEKYLAGSFRLGLSNKEVAIQKGISVSAVKMGRYRLRKKLQLDEDMDLVAYLLGI